MVKHEIDGHLTEFEVDVESDTWRFRVPDLDITGGGQKLLLEAKRAAAEIIALTLEDVAVSRQELDAAVAEIEGGRGLSPDEVRRALGRPEKGES